MTLVPILVGATGCATFADAAPPFGDAPTLTPNIATVIPSEQALAGGPIDPLTSTGGDSSSPRASRPAPADPCAPPQPPVIAVCLADPWGLAPLPEGDSALVGERLSGRILEVQAGQQPRVAATVTGLDTSHGGGLLGLALSPYYAEDGLLYAYVTTSKDARILRIAAGQAPQAVVTGLPAGGTNPGGSLIFDRSGLLYIATGTAEGAASLWRVDEFGRPAKQNTSGTPLFAGGFDDPTGLCLLPDGRVGVVDHRDTGDTLIAAADGGDYRTVGPGDAIWTYPLGDGGAVDCAVAGGALIASARSEPRLTSLVLRPEGGFTGTPDPLLDGEYGLLRTAVAGPGDLVWLTTANKAADATRRSSSRTPNASDDRVLILPPDGGADGGGVD